MEDEEDVEAYGILVGDLPKVAPALAIMRDLAAMQPLALKGVWNYTQGWATTSGFYSSGGYTWACMFCHRTEYATTDLYGNPLNHAGEFDHADDCLWKRAKEATDADA